MRVARGRQPGEKPGIGAGTTTAWAHRTMSTVRLCSLPLLLLLSLTACALSDDDELVVELSDEAISDDGKADHLTIAFRELDDPQGVGDRGEVETRVVLTSRAAYAGYFGHAAPADLDFSREWVLFYSAGTRSTGGYEATVASIARSASGKTLYVSTSLRAPGPDCLVTFALTQPHALVAFRRPATRPTAARAYHTDETRACDRCEGLTGEACDATPGCGQVAEGCDPAPINPDTGFPYPCDPILVCRAQAAAGEGDACGSRGLLPCAEGLFCQHPESAACGETDRPGTCAVAPDACIEIYQPVCGCDGATYGNACLAAAAEASVRHTGACR